ncbi:MAG: efflux RND transporter permease subunit, partial [Cyanobacteria bacterium NC_groundwater_1444_Ag_S-0.65um_54_12]|nr:efflux RND transporter permease subunit [Cyanobacteria bacterium NC_groundwater_1444_Ag_S-0.65um_54_12]
VFSLVIIIISFLPVFFLTGAEGKLFRPLAFTKTFAMGSGAVLAVTVVPVLMILLMRGRMKREDEMALSRFFQRVYRPVLRAALDYRKSTVILAIVATLAALPIAKSLGSEFMPPLDEGSLLFMPTTLPNVSLTEAKRQLQVQDRIIASFPEVAGVLGKAGRIDSPTDPAPISMVETIVLLKPAPEWPKESRRSDLIAKLDEKLQIPGIANFWTMPIINRINMLATGVRTDLGLKIHGSDLMTLQGLTKRAEGLLKDLPGASHVYADRFTGGKYIDIAIDREAIARYGLQIGEVQELIETAIGGIPLTTTVEGLQRYPVRLRVARELRDTPEALETILVPTAWGPAIPLSTIAKVQVSEGPPMISSENGMLLGIVFLNVRGRDMGAVIRDADQRIRQNLPLPPGYFYAWTGQYENLIHARDRLKIIIPVTMLLLFILLYLTFGQASSALLIMLSVPFSLVGGVALQALLDTNFSVAVWIGYLALAGVAIETGVVMLVYLNDAMSRKSAATGGILDRQDLYEATMEGAVLRLRPKLMTVFAALMGLVPILWSSGTGSDVLRPIAIPMIGGLVTSSILTLVVLPVLFLSLKEWELSKKGKIECLDI